MAMKPSLTSLKTPQEYPEGEIDRPSEAPARKALLIALLLVLIGLIMYGLFLPQPNSTPATGSNSGPDQSYQMPFKNNFGANGRI